MPDFAQHLSKPHKDRGCQISHENVKGLCNEYFGSLVDVASGELPGIKKKPAPDSIFDAIEALGADPNEVVYIGDSEVDVLTAKNAGISFIGVSWGFRDRADLIAEGAEVIADTADELLTLMM